MKSLYSILLKNALLLALVVASLIFIFTNYIGYQEVYYVFGIIGLLYVIASCFEAYQLSQVNSNAQKFPYFTDGFLAKRVIKIIVLLTCAGFLYKSHSIIRYLSFLCAIVAVAELVVTWWRYVKKLCFVTLTETEVIIATYKLQTMAIANIQKIETRHGLTYFVDKHSNSLTIQTYMMKNHEAFSVVLKQWLAEHQLTDKLIEQ